MPIYDINGNPLSSTYDANGNSLSSAYDIEGNQIWSASADPITLKVMSYNVQKFTGINAQQAMQNLIVNTYDADIIGIQELGNSATIPTVGQNMLTNYLNKQVSNHKNYLLSVSKALPFSNVVVADYQNQDPDEMTTYGETRAYIKADINVGGKTISFINTHLCVLHSSYTYLQMAELLDIAEQCECVIITGDFNNGTINEESNGYIQMYKPFVDAGYNLANNSPTAGFQNTYTSSATATSLSELLSSPDSIIVSSNIDIDEVIFDTTKFSYLNGSAIDHIPVIAKLTIN